MRSVHVVQKSTIHVRSSAAPSGGGGIARGEELKSGDHLTLVTRIGRDRRWWTGKHDAGYHISPL
jgi:hypothetical protein